MSKAHKSLRLLPPLARAAVPMTDLEADMAARAQEDVATMDDLRAAFLRAPSPAGLRDLRLAVSRANLSLCEYEQLLRALTSPGMTA